MTPSSKPDLSKNTALRLVILLGIVSLFADMTYESARSISGPYLATFGASAAVVGFVAGFGELLGYALRLVSGYLADRTGKYWIITIIGYVFNMLAVPLLALAGHWWIAASLMILERISKAIRVPARDAILSHASHRMGAGWAFGLHEALDQLGAMLGPLIIAGILYFKGSYQECFAILFIPAFLAITVLIFARRQYPNPSALEVKQDSLNANEMTTPFWLYLASASLIAAGYADFSLIAYHFQKTGLLSPSWIPIFYATAMGVDGIAAPLLGYCYDKKGFAVLMIVTIGSCLFAPLVFLGGFKQALVGIILWSIGVGAQESLMRAIVANMIPKHKRGSAYGLFNASFGICWFLGSVFMGILYDTSITSLVIFSVAIQLLAIPLLWVVMKKTSR